MILTRVRDQIALIVLFASAQVAALWFKRTEWLGQGAMTGQSYMNSTMWPAVLLCAIGAVVAWLPTHRALRPYFATSVMSERRWASSIWSRLTLAWILCQVVVVAAIFLVHRAVDGFGSPAPAVLALGIIWPIVWLTIGTLGFFISARWRLAFVVIAPVLCFYSIAGAAQLVPGPIAALSPVNIVAAPTVSDSQTISLLRLTVWALMAGLAGAMLWRRRLTWPIAVVCSLSLTASMMLLPGVASVDTQATRITCAQMYQVEVCNAAWQQASAPKLDQTVGELIALTPERLRFERVWLVYLEAPDPQRDLLLGAPGGNSLESSWPDYGLVRSHYVSTLVSQRCTSATSFIFVARGYRAFGLTELRLGPGMLSPDQLRGQLDPAGQELMARLDALPDATYFEWLTDLSLDPQWCNAPTTQWLDR